MSIIEASVGAVGDGAPEKMGFSTTYDGDRTSELRSQRVHLRTKAEAGYRVKTLPTIACTECVHVHEHGEAASTCDLVEGSVDGQHVCSLFALTESRIDQSVMDVRDWKTWDEQNEGGGKAKGEVENAHTPSNHIIPAEPNNAKTTNELKYITEGETAWEAHGAANFAAHDAAEGHGGNEPSPGGGHEGGGGGGSASVSSHTPSQNEEAKRAHEGMPKERSKKGMSETESSERDALSDRFSWEAKAVNAHQPEARNQPHKPYLEGAEGNRIGRFVKGYTNARHDARDRNLSAEDARAASDAHRAVATKDPKTGKKVLANPPQAERFGNAMGYKAHALEKEGKGQPAEWAKHDWSTGHPGERRVESPFHPDSEEHKAFAKGYHTSLSEAQGSHMDSEQAAARSITHHANAQHDISSTEKAMHLGSAKAFEHHAAEAPAPKHTAAPEGIDNEHFTQGRAEAHRQIAANTMLPEESAEKAELHAEKSVNTTGADSARHAGMSSAFQEHSEKEPSAADKIRHEAIRHANGPAIAEEHTASYNNGVDKARSHVEDFDLDKDAAQKKAERSMHSALGEADESKRAYYLGQAATYHAHSVHGDTDNVPEANVIKPSVAEKPKAPEPTPEPKVEAPAAPVAEVAPSAARVPHAPPGGPNPVGTRWTHKESGQFIVKKSDGSLRKFHEWGEPVRGEGNKIQDVPPHKGAGFEKALDSSKAFEKEEVDADEDLKPARPVAPPEPAKVEQQVHEVHEAPAPAPTEPTVAEVAPKTAEPKAEETAAPSESGRPAFGQPGYNEHSGKFVGRHQQKADDPSGRYTNYVIGTRQHAQFNVGHTMASNEARDKNMGHDEAMAEAAREADLASKASPRERNNGGRAGHEGRAQGFHDHAKALGAPEKPALAPKASSATVPSNEPRKIENPYEEGSEHFSAFNSQSSKTFRATEGMQPITADAAAMEHEAKAANAVDEAQKVQHLGTAAGYLRRAKEERDWTTAAYRGPVEGHSIAGNPHPADSKEHDAFRQNFITARRHSRYDELSAEDAQNHVDHQTGILNSMESRKPVDRAKVEGKIQGYQAHIEQLNNPAKAFSSAHANAFADVKPDKPQADLDAPYAKPEHVDLENSVLESSLRHLSSGNVTPQDLRNEARQDAEQSATTAGRGYDGEPLRATANGKLKAADQYEAGGGKAVPREGGTNKPPTEHTMMSHLQPGDRIWHNGESQFVHSNTKEPGKLREMQTVSEKTGEIHEHSHSGNTWFEKLPPTMKEPTVHGAPRLEDGQLELPQQAVAPVGHLNGSSDHEMSAAKEQGAADARDELSQVNPSREEATAHAASLRDEVKGRPQTQAEEQDHAYKTGMAETYEAHAAKPPSIEESTSNEETPRAPKGDEPVPATVEPGHEEAYRAGLEAGYAHGTDMHANQGKSAAQVKALASNTYFKQAKAAHAEGDFSQHAEKYGFARGLGRASAEKRGLDKAPTANAVASGAEEGPATDLGSNPVNNAEATISPAVVKEATSAPVARPAAPTDPEMASAVQRATAEGLKYDDIRGNAARAGAGNPRAKNEAIVEAMNTEAKEALANGDYSHAAWLDAHAKGYGQAL